MQFKLLTVLALGLFFSEVQACAKAGQYCQVIGNTACRCNQGKKLVCSKTGSGRKWTLVKNCLKPPNGGNQCVQGQCQYEPGRSVSVRFGGYEDVDAVDPLDDGLENDEIGYSP